MCAISVVIADDHPIVLKGIRDLLESEGDICVVGEAMCGREAMRMCSEHKPDVAVLDLVMPPGDGFGLVEDVLRRCAQTKVVVFTRHQNTDFAVRFLQIGVFGFVVKGDERSSLLQAVRKAHRGETYISGAILHEIGNCIRRPVAENPIQSLSSRELQVLRLIADGKKSSDIALELSLSMHTIQTYRRRLLEKLHMNTNAELVRFALETGVVN